MGNSIPIFSLHSFVLSITWYSRFRTNLWVKKSSMFLNISDIFLVRVEGWKLWVRKELYAKSNAERLDKVMQ
jgi:hypothetical protein